MARPKNTKAYASSRERLLEVGEQIIRSQSYADCGIKDVLAKADVPKGSFYHYFGSKEAFGIAVARHYNQKQTDAARSHLSDQTRPARDRLQAYFEDARQQMAERNFGDGCLMCNLSTELADQSPVFQEELNRHWQELISELSQCLDAMDLAEIGLGHLDPESAADWLLSSWSGALTRMKASNNDAPLALFMRTIFNR